MKGQSRYRCSGRYVVLAITLVAGIAAHAQGPRGPSSPRAPSVLAASRQALLVVTDDWAATSGTLERFQRRTGGRWRPVGDAVPVVVGRNGLAWGAGERGVAANAPIKKEGDGKSPAGVFRLGAAFGQSAEKPANARLPYRYLGNDVECVDDARSSHYNRLVSRQQVERADWTSSERMWTEPLYKRGVVVEYNTGPAQASAGSCIFLHIWNGPASTTAGCTALPEPALARVIEWLDAARKPVLIQLPRNEYVRLKARWKLP